MFSKRIRPFLNFLIIACLCMPLAVLAASPSVDRTGSAGTYERAVVEKVSTRGQPSGNGVQQVNVYAIRFLSGPLADQTREITDELNANPYALHLNDGDKIIAFLEPDAAGQINVYIEGYDRQGAIIWLILLFIATLVLLAGWQGLKVAFSITVSVFLIAYVLIPLFLNGVNPVPVAIALAGVFALITTGLTVGWNKKALVTTVGTVGGTLVAFAISLAFGNWMHLNGLSSDDDRLFFDKNPLLNPRGLLFAGIIIASVGVVEDVAVSIASGVWEVKKHNPRADFSSLFRSGMTIGNDHMGALANTLVFAYVGASLSTLLLYKQFGGSWLKFVNFDTVVNEVVRSLAGTIGLIFTVPITALLATWVMVGQNITDDSTPLHTHT